MKQQRSIAHTLESPLVTMGKLRLRQPLPNEKLSMVDPFLLLHHYGPFAISPFHNPFDLGPHPHRGFEPITLLFSGEQLHRDSLGNETIVKAGDVQWTTAGRGIVHAEGPSKEFVARGGDLEGIQLWLNLPAEKKMIPPKYQHLRKEEIPCIQSEDGGIIMRVVAGNQAGVQGKITTQTEVNVFTIEAEENGTMPITIPTSHEALVYLLDGEVLVNNHALMKKGHTQMLVFHSDGDVITLEGRKKSRLLVLSGVPFHEKVASWGPYVMNSQTEIMEALRDYQQGKMGYLY